MFLLFAAVVMVENDSAVNPRIIPNIMGAFKWVDMVFI